MKPILGLTLVATIALGSASAALARDGCGRGWFRGPAGHCRPINGGNVVVVRPVVGLYYEGRGYWDGRHYWQHRYRHHNGWRYR